MTASRRRSSCGCDLVAVFAVKVVLRAPGTVARLPRAIARYRAA